MKKPIGITMGDANGVGPEILLRSIAGQELPADSIIVGDRSILVHCNQTLDLQVDIDRLPMVDCNRLVVDDLTIGKTDRKVGAASWDYVTRAVKMCQTEEIAAMVTLPINKEAIALTYPGFSGHTGYIAALCGVENYTMMIASKKMIATHVSMHVSLREAILSCKKKRIVEVIQLTHDALAKLKERSRIAVAGLNPHAGEGGLFGEEEIFEIQPAIFEAQQAGIDVHGPFPPDTIFRQVVAGEFDAIVCMYHDQGHIPSKLLDFEGGVNVTQGLPIVRTSVDHGTAYDIAWQGKAWTNSLREAASMAVKLATSQSEYVDK